MIPESVIDWLAVSTMVREYQDTRRRNLTSLAADVGGIDKNTLSRLVRGGVVEADTLFWIAPWLGVTPAYFYRVTLFSTTFPSPPDAPIARLVARTITAGQEAISETVAAVGLAGELVMQVRTSVIQAVSRAIMTPPTKVFASDLLVPIKPGLVIDWPTFGQAVQARRGSESRADTVAQIGAISYAALRRVERGGVVTADRLFRLCLWLHCAPDQFYYAAALLTLAAEQPSDARQRLAEYTQQAVQAAVEATVTAHGVAGEMVTRLATVPATAAAQAILTAPSTVLLSPPVSPPVL